LHRLRAGMLGILYRWLGACDISEQPTSRRGRLQVLAMWDTAGRLQPSHKSRHLCSGLVLQIVNELHVSILYYFLLDYCLLLGKQPLSSPSQFIIHYHPNTSHSTL